MFPENLKIVIVAGGTGGHIYPGIALAEELRARWPKSQIIFIGSREGLEKELIPQAGFPIKYIWARALLRKLSYKAVSAPFIAFVGFWQALYTLATLRPKLVLTTGGYTSLPVLLAARFLGIKTYMHEQNVLPGVTNRLASRLTSQVFLSFAESTKYMAGKVVGNPVRQAILQADRQSARKNLGLQADELLILILGGSQGARTINQTVIQSLPAIGQLRAKFRLLHALGHRDAALSSWRLPAGKYPFYQPVEYLYNIAEALAAADLVVSRAGATAIAEFAARGLPMILIPFPFSAEGHQDLNADAVVAAGAGIKVANVEFTPTFFVDLLKDISKMNLDNMRLNCRALARPQAAREIVDALI